jgi:hypothetical protein
MKLWSERGRAAKSSPGTIVREFLYGALVATVCTALSFILALTGFGRLYYVAVFLPFFMLACLLVAWFLYLKDDGFIPSARASGVTAPAAGRDGSASSLGPSSNGSSSNGPDLSLFAPRGDELVPRKTDDGTVRRAAAPEGGTAGARRALLWAAVQLGLLAAALYSWAGVGAGYFIPVAQ